MHPEIAKRFESLEARRKALVERVRALPAENQSAHPDSKSFSPAEMIMHMAMAEQGNVAFLRKTAPKS